MFYFAVFSVTLILCSSPVFGVEQQELVPCFCTLEYRPLCGFNGVTYVTYSNKCQFSCAQRQQPSLTVFSQGPCPAKRDDELLEQSIDEGQEQKNACVCPKYLKPVCGSEGKTYGNRCYFACAQKTNPSLTSFTDGECKKPIEVIDPPVAVASSKRSARSTPQRCFCTREFRPVCGSSDGKTMTTYPNKCEFECAQSSVPGLLIISEGECELQAY